MQNGDGTGLAYVSDSEPGITRHRAGKGFFYKDAAGRKIDDPGTLKWIRSLAIPPAWNDVWISPLREGHIQAVGRDARGRKQYRYHPQWRASRDAVKFDRILAFGRALPEIRRRVDSDLRAHGLGWTKVVALVLKLLETTLIRVGNPEYARANKSYGLTTLRDRHLIVEGSKLRFRFRGKGGKEHDITLRNRRLAQLAGRCQDLPGQTLFQYLGEDGERRAIGSADINAYLHEIAGEDFTAKDFRTWAGTVLAAWALNELESFDSKAAAKRNITRAIESVASRLGNTPTICRKSYVHPEILESYLDGSLLEALKAEIDRELRDEVEGLMPEEAVVLSFLRQRLERAAEGSHAAPPPAAEAGGRRSSLMAS
jgi:DNA topoisomerase I